jgi:quercetin dioxygenase-like cupin family protein
VADTPTPARDRTIEKRKDMRTTRLNKAMLVGLLALLLGGVTVAYAATSVVSAVGTVSYVGRFDGPGTMTARTLYIDANEVLPWHQHPGIGAYTIVRTGTLTVEDGCGGEIVYPAGSAFIEPAGRIHRGIAGNAPVETVQTFLAPVGSAFSVTVAKGCGAPLLVNECKGGGWAVFTYPRTFVDQGDCVTFVRSGGH